VIPGAAGAVALLAALLLPALLLGLVVVLDRYEERLFSTSGARGRHAARKPVPEGRRAAARVRPKPPAATQ
jgi:hypothetical protein